MTLEPKRPTHGFLGLNIALFVVLCLVVTRTLVLDGETASERETSEAVTNNLEALSATKLAYAPDLVTAPTGSRLRDANGFEAINRASVAAQWRKLATSHTGKAAEWRRLGITLFLFHLPGGMEALRHVADHFPPPHATSGKGGITGQRADPFGHLPTSVPAADEVAMWETLYGPRPLTAEQTAHCRQMLTRLRLGWFDNVAAAQLYTHAGQRDRARSAAAAAEQSVDMLWRVHDVEIGAIGFGILGLLALAVIGISYALYRAGTYASNRASPSQPGTAAYIQAAPSGPFAHADGVPHSTASSFMRGERGAATNVPFPYPVLLLAFIVYLIGQEMIGLIFELGLSPFHARLESLSTTTLLRLTQVVQIAAYVPILGLPLLLLRRRLRYDPQSGEPLTLRQLLKYLGFRINNPLLDVGAGALGYMLVTPLVLLATLLSNWMFARFYTPQNPAALEMLAAQHGLDRFLVLFVASVAAPFAEETMFRGILYSALRARIGVWGAAAVSAAIFSLVHPTLPGGFLPIWAIGMGLALVYEWRKSLLPGMVLHGIHNGVITLMTFAIFAK
jgi:membrane protease YdiL (CAAX protease family)